MAASPGTPRRAGPTSAVTALWLQWCAAVGALREGLQDPLSITVDMGALRWSGPPPAVCSTGGYNSSTWSVSSSAYMLRWAASRGVPPGRDSLAQTVSLTRALCQRRLWAAGCVHGGCERSSRCCSSRRRRSVQGRAASSSQERVDRCTLLCSAHLHAYITVSMMRDLRLLGRPSGHPARWGAAWHAEG